MFRRPKEPDAEFVAGGALSLGGISCLMLLRGKVTGAVDSAGDTVAGGGVRVAVLQSFRTVAGVCLGSFATSGSVANGFEKLFVGAVFGAGLVYTEVTN